MNLDTALIDSLIVIKTTTDPIRCSVTPRDFYSLSYRIEGENLLYDGDSTIVCNGGSLTFVPAKKAYVHQVLTTSQQIIVLFTAKECIGTAIENFTLPLRSEIERLFFSLYNQWERRQIKNDLHCMSIFYYILVEISKNINQKEHVKDRLIRDSLIYMHKNYRNSNFNMKEFYEQIYISPAYFRRVFKRVYKISPIEYLKTLRINYAKQLLEDGFHTIADIAELSGFANSTYFSHEFKRSTGHTPSQYRLL